MPAEALSGLVLIALGLPVYSDYRRTAGSEDAWRADLTESDGAEAAR